MRPDPPWWRSSLRGGALCSLLLAPLARCDGRASSMAAAPAASPAALAVTGARVPEGGTYATADDAAWALVDALQRADRSPDGALDDVVAQVLTGRDGRDPAAREAIASASRERLVLDWVGDACVFVRVGAVGWRVPVPIVRAASSWRFGSVADERTCMRVAER